MLPSKLKNLNLFNDGVSYIGKTGGVTLPKLTRKLEPWRGGGMDGSVKIDLGQEDLEMEWALGGMDRQVLRQYGAVGVGAVMLRFAGAYQNDENGTVDAVEVVVRGRHEEIDKGEAKSGEDTEWKVKSALVYYKLTINGVEEIEIDTLNMRFVVGGIDRLAQIRAAIGA